MMDTTLPRLRSASGRLVGLTAPGHMAKPYVVELQLSGLQSLFPFDSGSETMTISMTASEYNSHLPRARSHIFFFLLPDTPTSSPSSERTGKPDS